MNSDWLTILRDAANAILGAFTIPGDFALSVVSSLGATEVEHSVILLTVLSLLIWILLGVVARKIFRNVARIGSAVVRTFSFRLVQSLRNLKTSLYCKFRQSFPQHRAATTCAVSETEFDDFDLAVLQDLAARGPGFTMSAPELAEKFLLRPSQVQRSLDKLGKRRLLEYVIGSTDGYDNYRLTRLGAAFVTTSQQATRGAQNFGDSTRSEA